LNNQAEQLAILKALENIQYLETNERRVLISIDSQITLESLKNRKYHTYLIEKIRKKVVGMEKQNWKIEFNWIKAHAGHHGNELADQLAKEAATNSDINECYKKIPKSTAKRELSDHSVTKW
jgi:ribonuclease HI